MKSGPLLYLRPLDNNIVSVTEAPGVQNISLNILPYLHTAGNRQCSKEPHVSLEQDVAWLLELQSFIQTEKKKLMEKSFLDSFDSIKDSLFNFVA